MHKNELYELACDYWGQEAQIDMCVEECSELIHAICKYKRNENLAQHAELVRSIAEEIADVEIMTEQLKLIMGITNQVDIEKSFKLARLEERLHHQF